MQPTTSASASTTSPSETQRGSTSAAPSRGSRPSGATGTIPDLVAELAACLRYLRFTGDPEYAAALGYLLDAQNADGSWGSYEPARARLGELVKQGFYLHTTMVAIEALSLGFADAFRRGEAPACP